MIKEKLVEELRRLISIPSYGKYEVKILEYIEEKLKKLNIPYERQEITEKGSYNIICGKGDFIISCHVDTVPPITMKNPTEARIEGGLVYGRGANDVKGQIAYTLVALEEYVRRNGEVPLTIAFVVDEENNSALGSDLFSENIGDAHKCLVLEPTSGRICTSQEGALEFRLISRGITAHGAESYKYYNPIKGIMDVVYLIEEILSREVSIFQIKGGWNYYVVPDKCELLAEVKVYKGESWEEVETKIKRAISSYTGEVEYIREDAENFIEFKKGILYEMMCDILKDIRGKDPEEGVMSSWTDAANYHARGSECIVFGYGDLETAHTERECIEIKDLEEGFNFMLKFFEKVQALKEAEKN